MTSQEASRRGISSGGKFEIPWGCWNLSHIPLSCRVHVLGLYNNCTSPSHVAALPLVIIEVSASLNVNPGTLRDIPGTGKVLFTLNIYIFTNDI